MMRNPLLAFIVLAGGCAAKQSTPPATGPTTDEPPTSTEPTQAAARWACSANIAEDGSQVSACWDTMTQCKNSDVQTDPPPGWTHSPCAPTATAFCFDADIIDSDGATVLMEQVPYCFITAPDCEQTRVIALADAGSANVTACGQR